MNPQRAIGLFFVLFTAACGGGKPGKIHLRAKVGADVGAAATARLRPGDLLATDSAIDTVVAMPHHLGHVDPGTIELAQTAPVSDDGSFDLELSTDYDWVLFLIDSEAPLDQRIVSYVSVPAGDVDAALVDMPIGEATGDLDLGELSSADNQEARADEDTGGLSKHFTLNVDQLNTVALVDEGFKQLANAYLNSDPDSGVYYESHIGATYTAPLDAIGGGDPGSYGFTGSQLQVSTNDPAFVDNLDSICDESLYLGLFFKAENGWTFGTPAEIETSDGSISSGAVTNLGMKRIDSSSCAGPLISLEYDGTNVHLQSARMHGPVSARWLKVGDNELGVFDFGFPPIDEASSDGRPTVPTPVPSFVVDQHGVIQGVNVKWYVYDPQSGSFSQADLAALEHLIASSAVGFADAGGGESVVYAQETQPITRAFNFEGTWRVDGRGAVQQLKVTYEMGGNNYSFRWTSEPFCGDRAVDVDSEEQCDREDLAGQDCKSLGYGSGTLDCRRSCRWDTSGCEPGLVGHWEQTGSMNTPRERHAAIRLADGRVLVAGGWNLDSRSLASAEIYDPATGEFTPTGSMHERRTEPRMTLLADGRVVVSGGYDEGTPTASSTLEIYDPATGQFDLLGTLAKARTRHTATYFPSSNQLLLLGGDGGAVPSYDDGVVFDLTTKQTVFTVHMEKPREDHTATKLPDGGLLIVGGRDWEVGTLGQATATTLRDAEYMPSPPMSDSGILPGEMTQPRWGHQSALLNDGRVLVIGGCHELYGGCDHPSSWSADLFFQDQRLEWFPASPLVTPPVGISATLLPSGHVLVTGASRGSDCAPSDGCDKAAVYYPESDTWMRLTGTAGAPNGSMIDPTHDHRAVLLQDGNVLAVGGKDLGGATTEAEIFVVDQP